MITSNVTFLYYSNLSKAKEFVEETLELPLVMDQGFALVYQVTDTSFLGIVSKESRDEINDTLYSFTVDDVYKYYDLYKNKKVKNMTEIKHFKNIPLKSFFFEDFDGHQFEIQEFLKKEDKELF